MAIFEPGTRVGPYDIVSLLGAGGMGEVYRARDARLGRDVAVKVIGRSIADDPALLARFEREARAVAALNHPNVITIHEIGDSNGSPFIAFELIEGETLRDRLLQRRMPLEQVLDVAVQVADGLTHAHEAGVLHRDLKPGNLMITAEGRVKILDFGLGKFITSSGMLSEATTAVASGSLDEGHLIGTVGYMSPEQVTGDPVDARSDQFLFGVVLYEMLTGARAFRRNTAIETLAAILTDNPPPLRLVAPEAPASLVSIVSRCLGKRPEDRYPATRQLLSELMAVRDRPAFPMAAPRSWWSRVAAALAIVVAMMATGAGVSSMWRSSAAERVAPRQVVVLPFATVGDDATGRAFSDGLVELLTTKLTQLEQFQGSFRVVPASEVRRNAVVSARDAERAFGADLVVSGSVQREGERLRLTINLIDVATVSQIAGDAIDGRVTDVLEFQDFAVNALARMLDVQLGDTARAVLTAGGPELPGAYDYYVQGLGYLQRFDRPADIDNAIALLMRAIDLDERFALAHAALGEAYWRKWELTKDQALIGAARAACAAAVRLDDGLAEVHLTLGLIARGTGEYETAVREFTRAIDINRLSADAYRELAIAYEALDRMDLAEATYKRAVQMRPGDWSGYAALGRFYAARQRYEEAVHHFRRVTELTPDNATAFSNLGGVLFYLKRYDEAAQMFERSVAIRPNDAAYSNLGTLYFTQGRFAEAARAYERGLQINDRDYRVWGNLAAAYQWVPDEAASRRAYEQAAKLAERERSVNPRRAQVVADLADFYASLGQTAFARELADRAMTLAPDDPRVLAKVGNAYEGLGDRARAIDVIARAIEAGYARDQVEQSRSLAGLRADPAFRERVSR